MKPKIVLVGLGELGSLVLDVLAREEWVGSLVVVTRHGARAESRANLSRSCAYAEGIFPDIRVEGLDLNERDRISELIRRETPQLVIHMATMLSWWLLHLLPLRQQALLGPAGFGMWLPVNLNLALKLALALRQADYGGWFINVPFPDVINCVLGKLNLTPTCGVGNLEELVPKIRFLAARKAGAPAGALDIRLVAHHALEAAVLQHRRNDEIPFYLRVSRKGEDVTEAIGAKELLWADYPLAAGRTINFLTAACILRLSRALFSNEDHLLHVPAPGGLPGGYPVQVSRAGVRLAETPGLTRREAVRINEDSHPFDGVSRIRKDGSVVFCGESVEIFRNELGYDCPVLPPGDCEDRAAELVARFREYASGLGVTF